MPAAGERTALDAARIRTGVISVFL